MSVDSDVSVDWIEGIREEAMAEEGALNPEKPAAAAIVEVKTHE